MTQRVIESDGQAGSPSTRSAPSWWRSAALAVAWAVVTAGVVWYVLLLVQPALSDRWGSTWLVLAGGLGCTAFGLAATAALGLPLRWAVVAAAVLWFLQLVPGLEHRGPWTHVVWLASLAPNVAGFLAGAVVGTLLRRRRSD